MSVVDHKYAKPVKILERKKENGVDVLRVGKIHTDEWMDEQKGKLFDEEFFPVIVTKDTDVYTEDGELLLRFRKNVLPSKNIADALEALSDFAQNVTTIRGTASGSMTNKKMASGVMSNIIGYFDKFSIAEKAMFKRNGIKPLVQNKVTKFTRDYPELWKKTIPLIEDIDRQYKELVPEPYKKQLALAKQTDFRITNTVFSTITTNVNFRTALHKDNGDYKEAFGNLVVIDNGKYEGACTGFPQYGVAADVRSGDFLAMDVHQYHANTAMKNTSPEPFRLSLVSYFRENIVLNHPNDTVANYYESIKRLRKAMAKSRPQSPKQS